MWKRLLYIGYFKKYPQRETKNKISQIWDQPKTELDTEVSVSISWLHKLLASQDGFYSGFYSHPLLNDDDTIINTDQN